MPHRIQAAARLSFPAGWKLPFHTHDHFHELVYLCDGGIDTAMEGASGTVTAGMAKLHLRSVPHQERAVGTQPVRILYVSWLESPGYPMADLPLRSVDRTGRLRQALEWLVDLGQRPATAAAMPSLFDALLTEYSHADSSVMTAGPMSDMQRWMEDNLAQPMSLPHLARRAGMSRFHFARLFRADTGHSPMEWLRRRRVDAVRTLLISTGLPLKAIAKRVGFPDEFHCSRVFRRVTGQSPTQVRRLQKQ